MFTTLAIPYSETHWQQQTIMTSIYRLECKRFKDKLLTQANRNVKTKFKLGKLR